MSDVWNKQAVIPALKEGREGSSVYSVQITHSFLAEKILLAVFVL